TVKKRLDTILMEGVAMLDQVRYLSGQGLKMESFLLRKHTNISEQEFEQAVSKGAPIDMTGQKMFYQAVDGKSTLFDVLRKRPLPKNEWVPVMFNMLNCALLTLADQLPTTPKQAPLEAIGIDRASIQAVLKALA